MSNQPVGTVSAAVANVRSGPDTSFDVIAQVKQGAVLNIVGQNAGGDWLQVCCVENQVGWLWAQLLVVEGSTRGLPQVQPPSADLASPPRRATPAAATPPPPALASPPRRTPGMAVTQPPLPAAVGGWQAEYFANRDLAGAPVLTRSESEIRFHLRGGAAPAPGVPGVEFSARWTHTFHFEAGDYTFFARADDGVRVKLDGWAVIDHWQVSHAETYTGRFDKVGAGQHTLTVEYFQAGGDAVMEFWWARDGVVVPASLSAAMPASAPAPIAAAAFPDWRGEYFNDIHLQGQPLLVRNDPAIAFDWHLGSPDPRVPADNFSARWTRRLRFEQGNYRFFARVSGGVRVYLNEWAVIDEWHDPAGDVIYEGRFDGVGAGEHTIRVEYYARGGLAYAQVWWEQR